ncbi:MAG TPA: ABC transporter substrate-binding protein [Dehalococcoidia bacterium]|nr:ABC transporter substrate-binding protein [Dehalococcoidia bacterium]
MRCILETRLFLLTVFILLIAVACSSAATSVPIATPTRDATPTPESIATPMPTATPEPTPTPVVSQPPDGLSGGSLTVAASADIPHRDVHQEFQETLTSLGPGLAYSRLLRLRTGPLVEQPSFLLECDLCESWTLTEDFAYEFKLRPNVRWQDIEPVDGRDLLADDLVYSYQRMQTPGWPNAAIFSDRGIAGFKAPDSETLRVNLAFLDSDTLLSLADGRSKIVAREVVEQYGDLKDSPVIGTGPWVWEETVEGVGTTLSKNPDYFEEGLPFLDELVIKVLKPSDVEVSSAQERLAALQAGQVDVATLPPQEWRQIYNSSLEFNSLVTQQAGSGVLLSINTQDPGLEDVRVRQAVFKALDPWEYVDLTWSGQGLVGIGMPVQDPGWLLNKDEVRSSYLANPSEARDLLVSTGQPLPVDIELAVAEFEDIYLHLGERVAEDLRTVGFNPTVRVINPSHYNEILLGENKEYQVVLGALPPSSSTNGFLMGLLHSRGPTNIVGHRDRTLDTLIEMQAAELDKDARRQQLAEIQRHILGQGYMFSPVMDASRWVFNWDLQGFYPNTGLSEYNYWSRVWLEQ